jgi:hypothetical protein
MQHIYDIKRRIREAKDKQSKDALWKENDVRLKNSNISWNF